MADIGYVPLTLRYLCMYNVQKVLPAVYDDSLSYYELLAKIQEKVNEEVTSLNNLNAWQEAQDEVIGLLEQKVDDFVNGGYKEEFDRFVQGWLDENWDGYIAKWAHMLFFGLTEDGYFCAYVPHDWSFVFGTVLDYRDPNYGKLWIKY